MREGTPKPLNLDPGTFGGTDACKILVEKLNRTGDRDFGTHVVSRFNTYFEGLNQMLKLDNPVRDNCLDMWFEKHFSYAEEKLKPRFEGHDIPFSYYRNIMMHRLRQTKEHGGILEKFRGENRDHAEILLALRNLAKYQNVNA